ncbi:putative phycocyanin operon protein Y [Porphyridium purpureum]|uniref:Putative phycocyanin operon protein Y n=1 Tax=Porphyridium purpureum TaxID=35688 RepID=A0A5J4YLV1_PORPP|nr:putative phycocyanin operon protein Y [Porphyridium purpureum]|eukprot:POR9081..scf249_10
MVTWMMMSSASFRARPGGSEALGQEDEEDGVRPQYQSTEQTFAESAGRDLYFQGMDEALAQKVLLAPAHELDDASERYIAAERLKFFPSEASTRALIKCVTSLPIQCLDDRVARRKAVETLGRYAGRFCRDEVLIVLRGCLRDDDPYTVEVAVWAISQIGAGASDEAESVHPVHAELAALLEQSGLEQQVNQRVVIQALLRLGASSAVDKIRPLIESIDGATASAAMLAVREFSGESDFMHRFMDLLRSDDLNTRRAAIEDVTLSAYAPALETVAKLPNSLVLRSRAVRKILDAQRDKGQLGGEELDADTACLLDQLIWDHPETIDLLGLRNETKKSRALDRNVDRLYKNDARQAYLAQLTIALEHNNDAAAQSVLASYEALPYFDYFAAYHVFKTLGWLKAASAESMLLEQFRTLPPRFFNHQIGAGLALASIGSRDALPDILAIGSSTRIWELKYACLIAAELLDDGGKLREQLSHDSDWLIRARARSNSDLSRLR